MSSRTFTLDEAQDLLPVLESLLRTSIDGKQLMESVDAELQAVAHKIFLAGGMSINVIALARRKAEREKAITYWHGVSEGFAGRKPIDARISKAKRAN